MSSSSALAKRASGPQGVSTFFRCSFFFFFFFVLHLPLTATPTWLLSSSSFSSSRDLPSPCFLFRLSPRCPGLNFLPLEEIRKEPGLLRYQARGQGLLPPRYCHPFDTSSAACRVQWCYSVLYERWIAVVEIVVLEG